MSESSLVMQIIIAVMILTGSLLFGLLFERIILIRLKLLADKTKWEYDEIVIEALRGRMTRLFTLAGFYGALDVLHIPYDVRHILNSVLLVVFILSVTCAVSNIAVGLVNIYAKRASGVFSSTSIFSNLTIISVFIIGALVTMQSLGISITPLLTALGVGGLAVALALQDTLSNFFAGLHILMSGPIKPGDYVKLDSGEEGYVVDITWRNTSIRALLDNMIIVPNSKMASCKVVNYSMPGKEVLIQIPVGVSYCCDLAKVEKVTIEVAQDTMHNVVGGISGFQPIIRFYKFGDFSIQFNVMLRAREFADQYLIRHEFIKRLQQRYRAEGIEIPYPIQTIYIKREDSAIVFQQTSNHHDIKEDHH